MVERQAALRNIEKLPEKGQNREFSVLRKRRNRPNFNAKVKEINYIKYIKR